MLNNTSMILSVFRKCLWGMFWDWSRKRLETWSHEAYPVEEIQSK